MPEGRAMIAPFDVLLDAALADIWYWIDRRCDEELAR
jgi:hypothetical protein